MLSSDDSYLIAHCPLPTAHRSLLTAHCSLLTADCLCYLFTDAGVAEWQTLRT